MSDTQVREHRGNLADSMKTVRTVTGRKELVRIIHETLEPFGQDIHPEQVHIKPYVYDKRIGWNTHIIEVDGYGVWGMADGPIE